MEPGYVYWDAGIGWAPMEPGCVSWDAGIGWAPMELGCVCRDAGIDLAPQAPILPLLGSKYFGFTSSHLP
ncbi:hypothetical protein llap_17089 [Limosa lapponica baueri]|uniref:Uncharacterized protein n=1 Tax=Limosa lapponica baueri TaxID=1758121 RepID=A0A2I0TFL7_LIMLA|nr:hypothetical protein llap_17089 [Limosa lapponica baueri]